MISRFAHKMYLKKDTYVIFNSILFQPICVSKEKVKYIFSERVDLLTKDELDLLYQSGIFIQSAKQDDEVEQLLKENINGRPNEVNLMYVIPYSGCNLACRYCFIGKIENNKALRMSFETIDNALQIFSKHLKKTKQKYGKIIFYGGEPTVCFDLIKHTIKKVKEFSVPIKFSMVTNGTLLDDEKIIFCKENNLSIGISIDGPKEKNDFNRFFKDSSKSVYDIVTAKIKLLQERKVDFGLSVTLTENLLDDENFLEWIKTSGTKSVNFNLLHYTSVNDEWKRYYRKASRFLFKAYDELSRLDIKDDRILRKINAFSSQTLKYSDCNAVGASQLTLKPNGDLTICHAYWNLQQEVLGNVNHKGFCINNIFDNMIYQHWKNNLTINRKACLKCPAIYICGTGCPKQAEDLFGSQDKIDKPFCIHTKHALKELFKRTVEDQ